MKYKIKAVPNIIWEGLEYPLEVAVVREQYFKPIGGRARRNRILCNNHKTGFDCWPDERIST